ncbi:MAG: hypothetical protein GC199_09170 [Alphaproteobacteria bacterium]|nr:hypothetical protein [Alphaproteobacteria bacterium]
MSDITGKTIAGISGILVALAADAVQKGDASALIVASRFTNNMIQTPIPPIAWVAAIVLAGLALVFIFEPQTRRSAFYTGTGILAVLMTFTPVTTPETLPTLSALPSPVSPAYAPEQAGDPRLQPIALQSIALRFDQPFGRTNDGALQRVQQQVKIPIEIEITLPASGGATAPKVTVRLHDYVSNRTFALGPGGSIQQTSQGFVFKQATMMPQTMRGSGAAADIEMIVEAEGYTITSVRQKAETPFEPVRLTATLAPNGTPLWAQRLVQGQRF